MKSRELAKIFIAALLLTVPLFATIINIPDDYATIQAGIDAGSDGDTVLVQPGTYMENINFNGHNIVLGSLFLTTGDTHYIHQTMVDGGNVGTVAIIDSCSNVQITGATLQNGHSSDGGGICSHYSNIKITDCLITYNHATSAGGIFILGGSLNLIYNAINYNTSSNMAGALRICFADSALIDDNTFYSNEVVNYNEAGLAAGGAICCDSSGIIELRANRILNNESNGIAGAGVGGGLSINDNDSVLFVNNVIGGNSAYGYEGGIGGGVIASSSNITFINNVISSNQVSGAIYRIGGGLSIGSGEVRLVNTLVWGNDVEQINGNLMASYCSIQDTLWPGIGNISNDPLFRDPEFYHYNLMAIVCGDPYDSPCIDAGDPSLIDTLLDCDWGLGTERSDMGAYGGGEGFVGIDEPAENLPLKVALSQNYPNPFNLSTMIKYELPKQSQVKIDIYDILGRRVAALEDAVEPAGYHQLIWNAEGVSSGVFFYKLQAGEYIETRKMMLIK